MKAVRRILRIHQTEGFKVFCLFNNGESRIIDFESLFKKWEVNLSDIEFSISQNLEEFGKVKLIEGTLAWENLQVETLDKSGVSKYQPFDLDPIMLYENSDLDESRQLEIGMLIKKTRTELGFTQEELAERSGTTKHYISRVENNRTGIEVSTLKKIIEGGLGRRMKITIQ
jgi:DNA-binding XRE family transcriptional regulator